IKRRIDMKYYHLIGFSTVLMGLQFTLQTIFGLELPSIIKQIFLGTQATLLVSYSLLFFIFLVKKKKKPHKEEEQKVVPIDNHQKEAPAYSKAS
ncbi:MAG: hypothetical protein L0J44_07405, partial [Tetragenococcus koreensis]|nr:hypothetical protein [Tetragenococcus koreensis]